MSDDLSRDDAMQIAMKFCGYRERSIKEVEDKLIAKSFNQKIKSHCSITYVQNQWCIWYGFNGI